MKRLLISVTLLFGLVAGLAVLPTEAGAATPAAGSCSVTWGSGAKSAGPPTSTFSEVLDVRTGRHACYDRFVVDLGGPASGYFVHYVRRFRQDPSGQIIPLPGGARIEIIVRAPPSTSTATPPIRASWASPCPG